ncbi:hypothetical protein Ddye_003099 [Dipteronia dyeriana]|uniref:Uncharacterized protein n=1 Tax=Dipteronia dyeriana TaxID=168575 RepID=A0AAE0CUZ6_9ROSI|nr:hypothetical protein Ddye_003099 [Dipteronia dyeriana]
MHDAYTTTAQFGIASPTAFGAKSDSRPKTGCLILFLTVGNENIQDHYDVWDRSFQIEHACNNPHTPIEEPEVVEAIGWCDKEIVMFDYEADSETEDTESGEGEGIDGHEGDEGVQSHDGEKGLEFDDEVWIDGHEEDEGIQSDDRGDIDGHEGDDGVQSDDGEENDEQFEFFVGDDELTNKCMALFEGYQSVSDDEYFSDSNQDRIAKLMKGRPFQRLVVDEIKFSVGQTFDNMVVLRDIFRHYAIQKGVDLGRIKNDLIRQTYQSCFMHD